MKYNIIALIFLFLISCTPNRNKNLPVIKKSGDSLVVDKVGNNLIIAYGDSYDTINICELNCVTYPFVQFNDNLLGDYIGEVDYRVDVSKYIRKNEDCGYTRVQLVKGSNCIVEVEKNNIIRFRPLNVGSFKFKLSVFCQNGIVYDEAVFTGHCYDELSTIGCSKDLCSNNLHTQHYVGMTSLFSYVKNSSLGIRCVFTQDINDTTFAPTKNITVDWGDGTTQDVAFETNFLKHEYQIGQFVPKIIYNYRDGTQTKGYLYIVNDGDKLTFKDGSSIGGGFSWGTSRGEVGSKIICPNHYYRILATFYNRDSKVTAHYNSSVYELSSDFSRKYKDVLKPLTETNSSINYNFYSNDIIVAQATSKVKVYKK